jgi:hypothetical protein
MPRSRSTGNAASGERLLADVGRVPARAGRRVRAADDHEARAGRCFASAVRPFANAAGGTMLFLCAIAAHRLSDRVSAWEGSVGEDLGEACSSRPPVLQRRLRKRLTG